MIVAGCFAWLPVWLVNILVCCTVDSFVFLLSLISFLFLSSLLV